jgi:hypothetical protein
MHGKVAYLPYLYHGPAVVLRCRPFLCFWQTIKAAAVSMSEEDRVRYDDLKTKLRTAMADPNLIDELEEVCVASIPNWT